MTSGFWAYGSILQMGDSATPEAFTAIAELVEGPDGPDASRDSIDMTNHQSTNAWKESIPGFRDGGTIGGKSNWLPNDSSQDENTGYWAHFNQNTNRNWRLVLPNSIATFAFSGHATKWKPSLDKEKQGMLEFEIKINGPVTQIA